MKASTIDVAGLDGGLVRLAAEQLDELDSRVECPLLRAGDAGWDDAVLIWNGMVAKPPHSSSSRPRPPTSLRRSGSRVTTVCC
jgi:hypothetical protein